MMALDDDRLDVPDTIVVGSLRWQCSCGDRTFVVSGLVPGLSMRVECPWCGSSAEFVGPEAAA